MYLFKTLIMGACCLTSLLEQNFHSYCFVPFCMSLSAYNNSYELVHLVTVHPKALVI
jgi:hypothetical protein